jgi:hypothetical protein
MVSVVRRQGSQEPIGVHQPGGIAATKRMSSSRWGEVSFVSGKGCLTQHTDDAALPRHSWPSPRGAERNAFPLKMSEPSSPRLMVTDSALPATGQNDRPLVRDTVIWFHVVHIPVEVPVPVEGADVPPVAVPVGTAVRSAG